MKKLLIFSTPRCPNCLLLKPVIEELAGAHGFTPETHSLGENADRSLFEEFGVRGAPTMVAIDLVTGVEIGRSLGFAGAAATEAKLRQWGIVQ
jgi:thioredoxin-like negative regulator of GroEL